MTHLTSEYHVHCSLTDERWHSLKAISEERRHVLEGLVDDLEGFKVTYEALTAWLSSKDKMVSALGPLATDLSMLNTQLQQVQVGTNFIYYYIATSYWLVQLYAVLTSTDMWQNPTMMYQNMNGYPAAFLLKLLQFLLPTAVARGDEHPAAPVRAIQLVRSVYPGQG